MRRAAFYLFIIAVFLAAPLLALPRHAPAAPAATPTPTPAATAAPAAAAPYRAVWVSYLEWQQADFSTADTFAADAAEICDNIRALGGTVVLAQVRPFGDALYPSAYFPFSHLCTGTQGVDPGFDPLAILVEAATRAGWSWRRGSTPTDCNRGLFRRSATTALHGSTPAG